MAMPSKVEVPRPISSRISSERGVAFLRISATSVISTMKVDWPEARSSDAPMRVKSLVDDADARGWTPGRSEPIWAMRTISATCRM